MLLTEITLINDAFYTTDVDLEGNRFRLQFSFCTRTGLYYLDLFTSTGVPIVYGAALVPNTVILDNLDLSSFEISGVFILYSKGEVEDYPNPQTFGDNFSLFYAFDEE